MTTGIGINGFGRIGRNIFRLSLARNSNVKIKAINDLTDAKTLAHLLKYDSVHGILKADVSFDDKNLIVNGEKIAVMAEKDPTNIAWGQYGCEIIHECTGIFTDKAKASFHLKGGAKKIIISAPSSDPDITVVYGVNHTNYDPTKHTVLSNASCTTNCLAPAAKVILENFGILRGTMTTIHSYTNDQKILDLPHKDLRRARAAALSMIPTTTGAAKAVGLVLPELKGKVDGFAMRVPTPNVSVVDFVAEVTKDTTVEEVNKALKAASEGALKGILGYTTEELVSCDYNGNLNSSTIDSALTMVIDKRLVKVITWYDNEMGFSARMLDLSELVAKGLN